MTETAKTAVFAGVALVLVVLALATRPTISRDPAVFQDTGEPFYPDLTDASVPQALEVIEFDESMKTAKPFRVEYKNHRWTIPSHHNYPADAADRLKKTAGAILGLKKDSIQTDNKQDHEDLGVIDPFETGAATKGWGTHVKLFDKDNNVVADLIFGKDVPNRPGFKFVRVPGKDRVYAVQCKDLDLSIKFADWIDTSLLEVSGWDLDKITIKDYAVDLAQRKILNRGTQVLVKDKENAWKLEGLNENEETNKDKASQLASAIGELKIVGVREKPKGLKPDLRVEEGQILAEAMQARGFYPLKTGDVVSNEGEVLAESKDGLVYTLRFGGAIYGTGEEVTAGKEKEKAAEEKKAEKGKDEKDKKDTSADAKLQENRFLLVTVTFDESKFPAIPDPAPVAPDVAKDKPAEKAPEKAAEKKPADKTAEKKEADKKAEDDKIAAEKKAKEEEVKRLRADRDQKIKRGKDKAKELSDRYANWFYVIPNDTFKKIRLSRADLVQEKKKEEKPADASGTPGVVPAPPTTTPPEKKAAPAAKTEKPAAPAAKGTPSAPVTPKAPQPTPAKTAPPAAKASPGPAPKGATTPAAKPQAK